METSNYRDITISYHEVLQAMEYYWKDLPRERPAGVMFRYDREARFQGIPVTHFQLTLRITEEAGMELTDDIHIFRHGRLYDHFDG